MRINSNDLLAGLVFIAFGVFFAWGGWNLEIGPALQMGPGNFPITLCFLLCAIGLVIVVQSFANGAAEPQKPIRWRGVVFTLAAPVIFGMTVRGAGFVPAVALTVFSSSCASERFRFLSAILLTVAVTAVCLAVFVYALDVSIPIFGPWITG